MNNTIKKWTIGAAVMALMLSLAGISVHGQKTNDTKEVRKQQKEGSSEAREATDVFRKIMSEPDKAIPRELLEKAQAIGVFPNVVKAGFIVGVKVRFGRAVITKKPFR